MEALRVALLQSRREENWRDSLRRVLSILSKYRPEADILALSENWLSREPLPLEDYEYAVERVYEEFGSTVLGGSNYVVTGEGPLSASIVHISGRARVACEKLFPSRAVGERDRIIPGRFHPPFSFNGWRLYCAICVDIFYPEPSRVASLMGADIIYNPASIPSDRIELWHSVLLARAAENTVFTIGVNGVGYVYPDGRITLGSSAVFAPNGVAIGSMGTSEGVSVFLLDRRIIQRIRERWAFYDDLKMSIASKVYRNPEEALTGKRLI